MLDCCYYFHYLALSLSELCILSILLDIAFTAMSGNIEYFILLGTQLFTECTVTLILVNSILKIVAMRRYIKNYGHISKIEPFTFSNILIINYCHPYAN